MDMLKRANRSWTSLRGIVFVLFLFMAISAPTLAADAKDTTKTRELFGDLGFANGFLVHDGTKQLGVLRLQVPGEPALNPGEFAPIWKLAQHNSRFDLTEGEVVVEQNVSASVTPGQRVALTRNEEGELVLFLDVMTNNEYRAPRRAGEPWIHLLLVQDFPVGERVSFGDVTSLTFSCDARVCDWERLMTDEEFDSGVHATQASVYFAISNDNPHSADYQDFIWFGVSFFDDRAEVQSQYVEVDGDPRTIGTGKLIYRLGEQKTIDELMGGVNPYSKEWAHIDIDLAQYVAGMLLAAQERGFLVHTNVADLKLSHFNYGWETPGIYRSSLAIKNLHLKATFK